MAIWPYAKSQILLKCPPLKNPSARTSRPAAAAGAGPGPTAVVPHPPLPWRQICLWRNFRSNPSERTITAVDSSFLRPQWGHISSWRVAWPNKKSKRSEPQAASTQSQVQAGCNWKRPRSVAGYLLPAVRCLPWPVPCVLYVCMYVFLLCGVSYSQISYIQCYQTAVGHWLTGVCAWSWRWLLRPRRATSMSPGFDPARVGFLWHAKIYI